MEELIYRAKLAEQAERPEEMVALVKQVMSQTTNMTEEIRNLLSVAYKTAVSNRRSAWRQLHQIEGKEKDRNNQRRVQLIQAYRFRIEEELDQLSQEIIQTSDKVIQQFLSSDLEGQIFFYKLKGDYYRYLSEYQTNEINSGRYDKSSVQNAEQQYQAAMDIAERSNLEAVHPTRLGLALNFSVYYYEVKGQPQNACNLAKKAFDEAIAGLDECNEEQYKEATNILQLMRDNLTLWQAEVEENDKDGTTVEDIF